MEVLLKKTEIIDKRFQDLLEFGNRVLSSRRAPPEGVLGDFSVDLEKSQEWSTSTAQLLKSLFGPESEYYKRFQDSFQSAGYYSDMVSGVAVLKAAWGDYSKGYLVEVRSLVEAEIFGLCAG